MSKLWKRILALCLLLTVLTVGMPTVRVATVGAAASQGVADTVLPFDVDAASVLGITSAQVASLRTEILTAVLAFEQECDIERYGIVYSEEVNTCLSALIRNTMPEAFHVASWTFNYRGGGNRIVTRVRFTQYRYTEQEYRAMVKQCDEIAEQMTRDLVNSDLTEEYKALLLHDRLATWVDYDNAAVILNAVTPIDHTMYGALCNRIAVCDGYAKAYIYLLRRVGMESYICRSQKLGHAWNIVKVDGKWYHVDVTWDDPVWDVTGRVNHKFFLLSSNGIYAAEHAATDYDTNPTDTRFESKEWPWHGSATAFQYLNGRLYYIDNARETLRYCEGNALYDAVSVEDTWYVSPTQGYAENFARLSADGQYLYYSLAKAVHRYDPVTGTSQPIYSPQFFLRPYHNIYGMKTEAGMLYCDVTDSPNFDAFTKALRQERVKLPAAWRMGNVDGDDKITSTDARLVLQLSVGKVKANGLNTAAADVNKDNKVDSTDARMILQMAVGKIKTFG